MDVKGPPYIIHREDLKTIAPTWRSFSETFHKEVGTDFHLYVDMVNQIVNGV